MGRCSWKQARVGCAVEFWDQNSIYKQESSRITLNLDLLPSLVPPGVQCSTKSIHRRSTLNAATPLAPEGFVLETASPGSLFDAFQLTRCASNVMNSLFVEPDESEVVLQSISGAA